MAVVRPISNREGFDAWVAGRPRAVQEMVRLKPPDRLYKMQSGHRCTIYSYAEDGTVTVAVTGEFNRVVFSRQVFGISIEELIECDPPGPDEDVGDTASEAGYTDDDVRDILIPKMRARLKTEETE